MAFSNTLVRSKRKTLALIVQGDGSLLVRAPLRLGRARIDQFVAGKADWISKHRQAAVARPAAPAAHHYSAGEQFWFLGQRYPLEIVPEAHAEARSTARAERPLLELKGGKFRLAQRAVPQAAEVFTAWYKQQARLVLAERVQQVAACPASPGGARHGLSFQGMHISSARTRWGSCSSRGSLSFTWRLVLAPLEVVDYVVAHELAHLRVRNHSPAFWQEVSALLPDYAPRKQWLKANGHLLNI
jgi:predicted metal-dependent hydrolase